MHKNATKCNETLSKWCKNKDEASKIIDTFETYQAARSRINAALIPCRTIERGMAEYCGCIIDY
jgi:hypothetical protein